MFLSRSRTDAAAAVLGIAALSWSLPSPGDINVTPTLGLDNYIEIVDSVLDSTIRREQSPIRQMRVMRPVDPGLLATRAVQAIDEALVVTTTVPLSPDGTVVWPFSEGQVSIVAADGSRIELDASNGDRRSVGITIVSGARHHEFREDWSTWVRR